LGDPTLWWAVQSADTVLTILWVFDFFQLATSRWLWETTDAFLPQPPDNGAAAASRHALFQKGAALATAAAFGVGSVANAYSVPDLPYPFEALEPHIDAPTMKLHHDKHHATYVANINKATFFPFHALSTLEKLVNEFERRR